MLLRMTLNSQSSCLLFPPKIETCATIAIFWVSLCCPGWPGTGQVKGRSQTLDASPALTSRVLSCECGKMLRLQFTHPTFHPSVKLKASKDGNPYSPKWKKELLQGSFCSCPFSVEPNSRRRCGPGTKGELCRQQLVDLFLNFIFDRM